MCIHYLTQPTKAKLAFQYDKFVEQNYLHACEPKSKFAPPRRQVIPDHYAKIFVVKCDQTNNIQVGQIVDLFEVQCVNASNGRGGVKRRNDDGFGC